jgi:diguanylate cyclase (GGDEF)-like protein
MAAGRGCCCCPGGIVRLLPGNGKEFSDRQPAARWRLKVKYDIIPIVLVVFGIRDMTARASSAADYRRGYSLKSRLYAVIGFLAVLPVCGAIVAGVALEGAASRDVDLGRYARGAIYLERMNGLVYAATMEARGIYSAANWPAAESSATRLTIDLNELQRLAPAWRAQAVGLREENIDELSRRVDQFIKLGAQVVRLAKEQSPAAARALGENEANRAVRATLNQSLQILADTYAGDLAETQHTIRHGQHHFLIALASLALVGGIALACGFLVLRGALLQPLLRLQQWMRLLAAGDFDSAADRRGLAPELADMVAAIEAFRIDLIDRRRLTHETHLLSAFNQWLQSCNSLDELYDMIGAFLTRLLPSCAGNLFIYANSRDVLENATVWNGGAMMPAMHPEDCWGLRRGRTYTFGEDAIDFPCGHLRQATPDPYCCIPILAHGETVGLLHLKFSGDAVPAASHIDDRRLGTVCAEQISLAIANVKLRDQLRDQSIRDPLTGLFNRRYLMETCRREFARAARAGQSVGVLSIDVDHFKKYNDNHGHDAGDTVLRAVGGCLNGLFRAEDVPCRFGGEEFVVTLPGANLTATARRAEQLRAAVEGLVVRYLDRELPRITVSIGVATFPEAGDTPTIVLRVADEALYRAKAGGRNRVEVAETGSNTTAALPPPAGDGEVLAAAADG